MDLNGLLILSIFLVALLYASVGHGGASGYLAVLSLWGIPAPQMAASALILNLIVSGVALAAFSRGGYFSWKLTWPFALLSVPAAWMGGCLKVSPEAYHWLLGAVLLAAACRLWVELPSVTPMGHPRFGVALPAGAGIGLLSGTVGIGGGIFLSPLIVLKRWADPKRTAAASAFFILVNSAAGLLGRASRGHLVMGSLLGLILPAVLGGVAGSALGANHFSGLVLRRILAVVLAAAAIKMVVT